MLRNLVVTSTFIMTISAFGLGVFTLFKNHKSKVNITWFLTSMAVTIWGVGYMFALNSKVDVEALKYFRLVYIGASLIPVFYFHFIIVFLYQDKKCQYLLYLGYIFSLFFLISTLVTNIFISGVVYNKYFDRYEEIITITFKFFLVYFLFFSSAGVYLLLKNYFRNDGIRKKQIKYILVASLFGFIGGISNFVTDLTGIYPYGQLVVWVYPILITYGIFLR